MAVIAQLIVVQLEKLRMNIAENYDMGGDYNISTYSYHWSRRRSQPAYLIYSPPSVSDIEPSPLAIYTHVFPLQQPAPRQYLNIPILLGDSQVLQILRVGSDNGHGSMDSRRNYFREYRGHGKSYSPAAAATTSNAEGASSSGIEIGYGFQLPADAPISSLTMKNDRSSRC